MSQAQQPEHKQMQSSVLENVAQDHHKRKHGAHKFRKASKKHARSSSSQRERHLRAHAMDAARPGPSEPERPTRSTSGTLVAKSVSSTLEGSAKSCSGSPGRWIGPLQNGFGNIAASAPVDSEANTTTLGDAPASAPGSLSTTLLDRALDIEFNTLPERLPHSGPQVETEKFSNSSPPPLDIDVHPSSDGSPQVSYWNEASVMASPSKAPGPQIITSLGGSPHTGSTRSAATPYNRSPDSAPSTPRPIWWSLNVQLNDAGTLPPLKKPVAEARDEITGGADRNDHRAVVESSTAPFHHHSNNGIPWGIRDSRSEPGGLKCERTEHKVGVVKGATAGDRKHVPPKQCVISDIGSPENPSVSKVRGFGQPIGEPKPQLAGYPCKQHPASSASYGTSLDDTRLSKVSRSTVCTSLLVSSTAFGTLLYLLVLLFPGRPQTRSTRATVPPVTFSPPPLRTRSAQEPPCISGWGGLWKRTVPCGSLDWLLECDGPLDWDRRRSLDRDLARPLDEVPFRWPWERLLDRDLDLDRLLACCDESRLSTPVAAERLFELELRCAGWLTPSSALAALKLPLAFSPQAVARSVALAFVRLELFFTAAERQPCSSPNSSGGSSSPSIITAAPSSILAQQVERRARPRKGASCPADANSAFAPVEGLLNPFYHCAQVAYFVQHMGNACITVECEKAVKEIRSSIDQIRRPVPRLLRLLVRSLGPREPIRELHGSPACRLRQRREQHSLERWHNRGTGTRRHDAAAVRGVQSLKDLDSQAVFYKINRSTPEWSIDILRRSCIKFFDRPSSVDMMEIWSASEIDPLVWTTVTSFESLFALAVDNMLQYGMESVVNVRWESDSTPSFTTGVYISTGTTIARHLEPDSRKFLVNRALEALGHNVLASSRVPEIERIDDVVTQWASKPPPDGESVEVLLHDLDVPKTNWSQVLAAYAIMTGRRVPSRANVLDLADVRGVLEVLANANLSVVSMYLTLVPLAKFFVLVSEVQRHDDKERRTEGEACVRALELLFRDGYGSWLTENVQKSGTVDEVRKTVSDLTVAAKDVSKIFVRIPLDENPIVVPACFTRMLHRSEGDALPPVQNVSVPQKLKSDFVANTILFYRERCRKGGTCGPLLTAASTAMQRDDPEAPLRLLLPDFFRAGAVEAAVNYGTLGVELAALSFQAALPKNWSSSSDYGPCIAHYARTHLRVALPGHTWGHVIGSHWALQVALQAAATRDSGIQRERGALEASLYALWTRVLRASCGAASTRRRLPRRRRRH
ncbi:hypothetical protein MRX96_043483 [Rhipicephalus microplus]